MKKTYYVKDIIQSIQVSSIENDGPYYETVLDVEIECEGKSRKQRDIIRRRFNKVGWDELVKKRYFIIDNDNDEEFSPEELENAKLLIGELYCDCNKEELERMILYSAALIKTRRKYESDIADLREEYGIDRIKEKYQKEAK